MVTAWEIGRSRSILLAHAKNQDAVVAASADPGATITVAVVVVLAAVSGVRVAAVNAVTKISKRK